MENQSDDVPLGPVKVGVVFNLKRAESNPCSAPDAQAEYDNIETVQAIEKAIQNRGIATVLMEADEHLLSS